MIMFLFVYYSWNITTFRYRLFKCLTNSFCFIAELHSYKSLIENIFFFFHFRDFNPPLRRNSIYWTILSCT